MECEEEQSRVWLHRALLGERRLGHILWVTGSPGEPEANTVRLVLHLARRCRSGSRLALGPAPLSLAGSQCWPPRGIIGLRKAPSPKELDPARRLLDVGSGWV